MESVSGPWVPPAAPAFAALPLPAPAASLKAKHRDREKNSQVLPPKGLFFWGVGEEGVAGEHGHSAVLSKGIPVGF